MHFVSMSILLSILHVLHAADISCLRRSISSSISVHEWSVNDERNGKLTSDRRGQYRSSRPNVYILTRRLSDAEHEAIPRPPTGDVYAILHIHNMVVSSASLEEDNISKLHRIMRKMFLLFYVKITKKLIYCCNNSRYDRSISWLYSCYAHYALLVCPLRAKLFQKQLNLFAASLEL